jgi:hypothetical protein
VKGLKPQNIPHQNGGVKASRSLLVERDIGRIHTRANDVLSREVELKLEPTNDVELQIQRRILEKPNPVQYLASRVHENRLGSG